MIRLVPPDEHNQGDFFLFEELYSGEKIDVEACESYEEALDIVAAYNFLACHEKKIVPYSVLKEHYDKS